MNCYLFRVNLCGFLCCVEYLSGNKINLAMLALLTYICYHSNTNAVCIF